MWSGSDRVAIKWAGTDRVSIKWAGSDKVVIMWTGALDLELKQLIIIYLYSRSQLTILFIKKTFKTFVYKSNDKEITIRKSTAFHNFAVSSVSKKNRVLQMHFAKCSFRELQFC